MANKTTSKKKESSGTVRQASLPSDFGEKRRERIRRGRNILQKVKESVQTLEHQRFSMNVATSTEDKYRRKEIETVAFELNREKKDVQLDVELAQLANRTELFDDDELSDAVLSSRLPLTKSSLQKLLKIPFEQLEEAIRTLLDEQL